MAPDSWSALVVEDDPGIRQSLRLCLELDRGRVLGVSSSSAALEALARATFDIVLVDVWLGSSSGLDAIPDIQRRQPHASIIVITALASFESAVDAIKRGASDYLPKPFTPEQVRQATRRALAVARAKQRSAEATLRPDARAAAEDLFDSASPRFQMVMAHARRVSGADVPVLLRGESGTGKNVMARWLWQHSARAQGPFISVSCPSLSSELMNSTLFGHKKGAFTGAVSDTEGKVQQAEGGILFLDEVGDLSPEAQASLLRFLNDGTYERVGEAAERHADVRILAATNRVLEQDLASGRFRDDLFYRLNVVTLMLPALRDRPEDLLALAAHYLKRAQLQRHRSEVRFSQSAERAITLYSWPGNLREMRNAVERAVILCPSSEIAPQDMGIPDFAPLSSAPVGYTPLAPGADVTIEAIEREHIARIVARAPTLESAARTLGIDSTTLQRKRKRYGLL